MKIAIFSDTFYPRLNGVSNTVYRSAKSLTENGHDVRVYTISDKSQKWFQKNIDGKFSVYKIPSVGTPFYAGERTTLPVGSTLKDVRSFKPDVIHTHTPFSVGWEAVLCSKLLKIPLVGTHHTFFDHYLGHANLEYEWAKKLSWSYTLGYYNRCNVIISPSHSLAEGFKSRKLKRPIVVLANSVRTDLYKPDANKQKTNTVTYMGRLSYEKSIDQIIKAMALVVKEKPYIKLDIIGDGPERKHLEKLTKESGVENNVIFSGYIHGPEMVKALNKSDVFVTASKSENMPLSVLEAMSTGLPIIAVSSLGMREIVRDGENGFLLTPDNPAQIAGKIIELLSDNNKLKKFSDKSRDMALEYSEPEITKKLIEIYQKLINK